MNTKIYTETRHRTDQNRYRRHCRLNRRLDLMETAVLVSRKILPRLSEFRFGVALPTSTFQNCIRTYYVVAYVVSHVIVVVVECFRVASDLVAKTISTIIA